jgi:hypothetical protein
MMEQPQIRMHEHHPMLICCFDTLFVHHAPTRCSKVPHTALPRPMHIIREREERVTRARNTVQLTHPRLLLLLVQLQTLDGVKERLPLLLLSALEHLAGDEQVDGVGLVCAFGALLEGEGEDAGVVAEPPEVGFRPGETGAVDARLLAGAEADDGAVLGVCDRVGLGVLEGEGGHDQVGYGRFGEL